MRWKVSITCPTILSMAACLRAAAERSADPEQAPLLTVANTMWRRDGLGADLRSALRFCARSPLTSAAVILTLAIGVAANTALFSVLNATLLKELPIANADSASVRVRSIAFIELSLDGVDGDSLHHIMVVPRGVENKLHRLRGAGAIVRARHHRQRAALGRRAQISSGLLIFTGMTAATRRRFGCRWCWTPGTPGADRWSSTGRCSAPSPRPKT